MPKIDSTIFPTPLLFRLKFGGVPFGVDPPCWVYRKWKANQLWNYFRRIPTYMTTFCHFISIRTKKSNLGVRKRELSVIRWIRMIISINILHLMTSFGVPVALLLIVCNFVKGSMKSTRRVHLLVCFQPVIENPIFMNSTNFLKLMNFMTLNLSLTLRLNFVLIQLHILLCEHTVI